MEGLEELTSGGWELLRLTNDAVAVDVLPGLGGTIVSLRRRSDESELLWRTPWGIRPRGSWLLPGSSEAQMLDTYPGGWQTLFPNGGDTAIVHGVEWGHDGESRLAPFSWEPSPAARTGEDGPEPGPSVTLSTRLVRAPFEVTRTIALSGDEVTVTESVSNVGGESLEVIWGQQIVLGEPLLSADAVVEAQATTVHPDPSVTEDVDYEDVMPWPRSFGGSAIINLRNLPARGADETRLAYVTDFSSFGVSVRNPRYDLGLDVSWDGDSWPYLWYSVEAGHREGFPWFSDGYFLSLTPCSSWPAHGIHDARRVASSTLWLHAAEMKTSTMTVRVHPEQAAG
jgi:hypothetical protein